MNNRYVSAVITDPYYDPPEWLNEVEFREYVVLSEDTSPEDTVLFFICLLGYNDVDVSNITTAFTELIQKEEVVIGGGILFENNSGRKILPSCCSGLEQWRDVLNGVKSKDSPWMGHTPYPTIEYINDTVRVWSDNKLGIWGPDEVDENMYFIEYRYDDLITKLNRIKCDLRGFAQGSLFKLLTNINEKSAAIIVERFLKWFELAD
ncbi:MAG TPA: hypothetical protein VE710_15905 [Candidatus Bathyarchaeia archaeon]|nr:hypothetical protein [Candidatus Bathyarchaeia archaeon]